ncbi:MAG: hypothetical protein A2W26_13070 [Acidobacteria bacterium RBG_16_64_8]|nr:MAG: hypothetical protein A2W26_13070 [Acidobacteria bacterium RBG_16_64_8]
MGDMKRREGWPTRNHVTRRRRNLSHQMLRALQAIFKPGYSRHVDRLHGRTDTIRGIQTRRSMVADAKQFARFVRARWPEVRELRELRPEMASAMIEELVERDDSGGRIGRMSASLRKLDAACRHIGVMEREAPELLPHALRGLGSSFHSDPCPVGYTIEEARRIVEYVTSQDEQVGRVLELMRIAGLRVSEAAHLRGEDIEAEKRLLHLRGAVNHSKGGRPREVHLAAGHDAFLAGLVSTARGHPDGHIFASRRSLPERARAWVQKACEDLGIRPLGTHGLRKTFATEEHRRLRAEGVDERHALRVVAKQLGHNRLLVVRQSYVAPRSIAEEPDPPAPG